jgi:hypothetical protein
MPGEVALHHLDRCLHDDQIPTDIRVAGALTLLYGLSLAQLSHLTTGHLSHHDDEVHLNIGRAPIVLPPLLATLIVKLAQQRRDPSPISRAIGDTTWLFPGAAAGRPARPTTLSRRLQRHAIAPGPARITALNALTAELSRATVSDLLDGNPRHLRTPRVRGTS